MPAIRITGSSGVQPPTGPAVAGGIFPNLNLPQAQGVQAGAVAGGGFTDPLMTSHAANVAAVAASSGGMSAPATGLMATMQAHAAGVAARAAAASSGMSAAPPMQRGWINGPPTMGGGIVGGPTPGFIGGSPQGGGWINGPPVMGGGSGGGVPGFIGGSPQAGGWINGAPGFGGGGGSTPGFIGGSPQAGGWINGPPRFPPPPGGGGGGGGSGGGGGGGYFPLAARMGFPSTGSMLAAGAAGGGAAVTAVIAAKAIEEILFSPQAIGSLAMGALGNAKPFIDLSMGTMGLGSAGRFGPSSLQDRLFPGFGQHSRLMEEFGLLPNEAVGMLQRFGVVAQGAPGRSILGGGDRGQQSGDDAAVDLLRVLGGTRFAPGLAGMPEGMANASAAQAAKYGIIGADSIGTAAGSSRYLGQLGTIMESAVAQGMDRASILRSIDASVALSAARGGTGISQAGQAAFLMNYAALPGGRTGEVGMDAAARIQSMSSSYGSNPIATFNTASVAGRLTSMEKLTSFIDRYVKPTSAGMSGSSALLGTPGKSQMANDLIEAARRGDSAAAGKLLEQLSLGQPELQTATLENSAITGSVPSYRRGLVGAGQTGETPTQYYERKAAENTGAAMPLGQGFDESKRGHYITALLRMGLSHEMISATMDAASAKNVDPIMLGALTGPESAFGTSQHRNTVGGFGMTGVENPWQVSGSSGLARPRSVGESAMGGATVLADAMKRSGGNVSEIARYYHGPFKSYSEEAAYTASVNAARGASGLPDGMLGGVAGAGQLGMGSSATSFREMAFVVPKVQDAASSLIAAIQYFSAKLNELGPASAAGPAMN